jgi:CDP-paratose 2-epimerase
LVKILVTGAAGFIGGHLVQQLAACGHSVVGVDKRTGWPAANLPALQSAVEAASPDVIVHLGASCSTSASLADPAQDFLDNAVGAFNVCEAARRAGGIPVLFTSSVKVYPGPDGLIAPLGQSKLVGEQYLRLYGDLYGLPHVILRPSTVYGPGQDGTAESGWVTWFLRAFLARQQITIHGDGTQSRDILHIDDFTALLVDIVENFAAYQGRTYEVGGGPDNEVGLLDLLRRLELSTGACPDVVHDKRLPGDLQRVVTDNAPVAAVRGWKPAVSWVDGVRSTLDWMGEQW